MRKVIIEGFDFEMDNSGHLTIYDGDPVFTLSPDGTRRLQEWLQENTPSE